MDENKGLRSQCERKPLAEKRSVFLTAPYSVCCHRFVHLQSLLASLLVFVLVGCVSTSVTGQETDSPSAFDGNVIFPVRAAFYYPWFPETWSVNGSHVFYNPTLGYYESSTQTVVDTHINALSYANVQVGIASWWGVNTHKENERIPLLINRTQTLNAPLKWALYYEKEGNANPSVSELKTDLAYIQLNYASSPIYARVAGKPVLFVYNADDRSCEVADRWVKATAEAWHIILKVFPGHKTCSSQPDAWHQYAPANAADHQQGYAYTISPGFWRADESSARLERDPVRWQQNVHDMVASQEPWQLITTFNEWGEGTAVEESKEWGKTYLEVLRSVNSR
jgi:Glycosyl hydrolase family 99